MALAGKKELHNIPSMASLGVLKPRPTLFQNLLPPLPGLFPLLVFFGLQLQAKSWSTVEETELPTTKLIIKQHHFHLPEEHLRLLQESLLRLQMPEKNV